MDYTGIIAAGLSGALIGAILGIPAFVIDISNLTDEQKALVAQLVDSMKK